MPETKASPMIVFPQISLANDIDSALPLEHTTVSAQVTGPLASVVVTQRFGNPLKEPAELDYLFPLPEKASITSFELQVGQRRIQGDLQEQESARTAYEDARGQGKRAGLFEQRRPNLFAMRLANVQAGETIQATVHYQQRLKFEEAGYEFIYPMGLTPKYDSPQHAGEGEGTHAPIARSGEAVGPVEINLAVDAGLPVGEPASPSHPVETVRVDEHRFQVRLAGEHIPDHDFVLRYPVAAEEAQAAGWTSAADSDSKDNFFLATLVPPAVETESEPLPREFIFVLDRSGSMSGEPILQARNALRACLRALNPNDTFRILLFDNELEWFHPGPETGPLPEPVAVTQEQVDRADAYLEQVQGRGGTEIVRALEAALGVPPSGERARFIVFLTDGAVSAEMRVLDGIRSRIGGARLFTFGIGPSVNRALLSRMAELGRGRSSFLQLNEDIEGAIIRFQDSVSFPALTDLTLEWENGKAWDVYPSRLPDLYYGQPLEICGRVAWSGAKPARLTLRGKRAGVGAAAGGAVQPVTLSLSLAQPSTREPAIERLWARERVDDLIEQAELEPQRADKLRAEIVGLALAHNLVTVYTSFVAIDHVDAVSGGQPRVIHVAQPLPQGLQPGPFMPGPQPMAMMASFMPTAPMPHQAPASAPGGASGGPRDLLSRGRAFLTKISDSGRQYGSEEAAPAAGQSAVSRKSMSSAPAEDLKDRESVLRWLARTQRLDGAWNDSVEWTSAALLAFVRAGYTTRSGIYRQALRRAVRYLIEHMDQGQASFFRARALAELAEATRDEADRKAAQASRLVLPAPSSTIESAALGQSGQAPSAIASLDDLRLAVLLRAALPVPPGIFSGMDGELAQVWAAGL
jgi:Ca-activated chloride channel homolog